MEEEVVAAGERKSGGEHSFLAVKNSNKKCMVTVGSIGVMMYLSNRFHRLQYF